MIKIRVKNGSYKDKIMKIVLESGSISGRCERLIANPTMPSKTSGKLWSTIRTLRQEVRELREENILKDNGNTRKGDYHSVSFTNSPEARKQIQRIYGERALRQYDNVSRSGRLGEKDKARWERSQRMSEVIAVMDKYGFTPFTFQKDNYGWGYVEGGYDIYNLKVPHFFTMKEIKQMMPESNLFGYTRLFGLLASEGGIYAVYNYGNKHYSWNNKGEMNAAETLNRFVDHYYHMSYGFFANRRVAHNDAIVFGNDMDVAQKYILTPYEERIHKTNGRKTIAGDESFISPTVHKMVYGSMRFIPLTHDGMCAMRILTLQGWYTKMQTIHESRVLKTQDKEYDAMNITRRGEEEYIFYFLTCDLHRLYDFMLYEHDENKKTRKKIICYEFQYDLVQTLADSLHVDLEILPYDTSDIMSLYEDDIKMQNKKMSVYQYNIR